MNYYKSIYGEYNTIVGHCESHIYIYDWDEGDIVSYYIEYEDYEDYDCSYDFDFYTLDDAHYDPNLRMKHNFRGKAKKEKAPSYNHRHKESFSNVVDEFKLDHIPFEVNVVVKNRRQSLKVSYTLIPVGSIDGKYIVSHNGGTLSILDLEDLDERDSYEYIITYANKNLDFIDSL